MASARKSGAPRQESAASDQVPTTGPGHRDHVTAPLSFGPVLDDLDPFEVADVLVAYADNENQLIRYNLILAEAEARAGNYERAADLTAVALGRLEGALADSSSDPDSADWDFYKPRGGASL